ncbi:nitroreductase family protein [Microbacterium sp. YY-03]|uniref:nitroreductase family protein n=1 Tax=Microbacterium sp. YY-03 TaxID=3421636 RepID=UPI003D176BA2
MSFRVKRALRRFKFSGGSLVEFARDWRRYTKFAFTGVRDAQVNEKHLEAQLTLDYHRVEKGLTFKEPKRPFGASMAEHFDQLVPLAAAKSEHGDAFWYKAAVNADEALRRWNDTGEVDERVARARRPREPLKNPERFFESRQSIRNFSGRPVEESILDRAVGIAGNAPSVCNRQPWQVRFLTGAQVAEARVFQNGNRGIDPIPVLAVVTVDARMFNGRGERNQGWIEGGIFGASLVYAFHALGVDTCMLNMSVTNAVADGLRKSIGLADHDLVITMIAVGYAEEGALAPRSARRGVGGIRA